MSDIFNLNNELPAQVDFAEAPPEINEVLKEGVVAYRRDRDAANALFQKALAMAPQELSTYFCLYKIHTYMGGLDYAAEIAEQGLREATRQAGWPSDPEQWPARTASHKGPGRFALFTLKALAFIELKRGRPEMTQKHLAALATADPTGEVGWPVIAELAHGVDADA